MSARPLHRGGALCLDTPGCGDDGVETADRENEDSLRENDRVAPPAGPAPRPRSNDGMLGREPIEPRENDSRDGLDIREGADIRVGPDIRDGLDIRDGADIRDGPDIREGPDPRSDADIRAGPGDPRPEDLSEDRSRPSAAPLSGNATATATTAMVRLRSSGKPTQRVSCKRDIIFLPGV